MSGEQECRTGVNFVLSEIAGGRMRRIARAKDGKCDLPSTFQSMFKFVSSWELFVDGQMESALPFSI
jgi:hypothetical protein